MTTYRDLEIQQGADVAIELHCETDSGSTKDLTNYTITAYAKRAYTDSASDPNTVQFNAIVANPSTDGIATLSLTNTQTDALITRGRYVYDVEASFVDSDGDTIVQRIMEGQITVSPSATK